MVDVERRTDEKGFQYLVVRTPKTNEAYIISKAMNGFSSYEVKTESGKRISAVGGTFTTPDRALYFLRKYIDLMKESRTVRRDKNLKDWKNRNAATTKPNDSDPVQQGSAD